MADRKKKITKKRKPVLAKKPIKVKSKKRIVRVLKKVLTKKANKPKRKVVLTKKANKKVIKKSKSKTIAVKSKLKVKNKTKKKIIKNKKSKVVRKKINKQRLSLKRSVRNPVLSPRPYTWENQAVFNPGVVLSGDRIHLFYRALGDDGISRVGYASSKDGVNFDIRTPYPVFVARTYNQALEHAPYTTPARLTFNPSIYFSGGGWGGCEDPRAVLIDGVVYMTFNMLNGWAMSIAVTSLKEEDMLKQQWNWSDFVYLSKPLGRQKNWVLFPEKIDGKFVLLYNLDKGDPNRIHVKYMTDLNINEAPTEEETMDPQLMPDHQVAWHYRTRSAAAPPIKTKDGWLLLYHAMDRNDPWKYKLGALLLDLKNPEKVLYRSSLPILEPEVWYENDYKPGIIYASGAVVKDGELYVYYGGGDKYVGLATIQLNTLLESLKSGKPVSLAKRQVKIK